MGMWIGRGRKARRSYGFDEIALVPGNLTVNPNDVDINCKIGNIKLSVPIMAAAMDGVVDPKLAIEMSRLGGLAVMNLEGIQTRYDNPESILKDIAKATPEKATKLVQGIYDKPIKEDLIVKRIKEIKKDKSIMRSIIYSTESRTFRKAGTGSRRRYVCCTINSYINKACIQ